MDESEEIERGFIERLPFAKLWLTLGVFALLLLAYVACWALFGVEGALFGPDRDPEGLAELQVHAVIALLIGYMLANQLRQTGELRRDLGALRPLLADDVSSLPPAAILAAEVDPIRPDAERYAARLAEAGVPAALEVAAGAAGVRLVVYLLWVFLGRLFFYVLLVLAAEGGMQLFGR